MLNKIVAICILSGVISGNVAAEGIPTAHCDIHPLKNSNITGAITLTEMPKGGVAISGTVMGLKANSSHGFHIHEYGDCSAPDGSSAGSHFHLSGTKHGPAEGLARHLGDLGNLVASDSGIATYNKTIQGISLKGGSSVIGRSLVVHAEVDDLKTDPSGNSGDRVGCGVIGITK